MTITGKSFILPLAGILACGLAVWASEKERPKFTPGAASSYETRQTIANVTVAAVPYATDTKTAEAFGKLNPNREGILPVLVVIENGMAGAVSLDHIKAELITPEKERIEATPAADLKYLSGADAPKVYTGPIPGAPPHVSKKKKKLAAWEIEGRAFSARMLPPKDSANGFFYFRAPYQSGSTLYLTGMREAASGKELFYFEIPLDKNQ